MLYKYCLSTHFIFIMLVYFHIYFHFRGAEVGEIVSSRKFGPVEGFLFGAVALNSVVVFNIILSLKITEGIIIPFIIGRESIYIPSL